MTENDKEKCPHPAVFRYTWAGKPESMCCVLHGKALRVVADAIGYPFQLILIGGINPCQHPDDLPKEEDSD